MPFAYFSSQISQSFNESSFLVKLEMLKELIIKETNISGELIILLMMYFHAVAQEQILSMTNSV